MLVLQTVVNDDRFRHLVKAEFNDVDAKKVAKLQAAVTGIAGIGTLSHAPSFDCRIVDEAMAAAFEAEASFPPTLSFVDPWGYKGLSVRLIRALTQHRGCDCIFFFNYNRVNLDLNNPLVREELNGVFGADLASRLRERLVGLSPEEREQCIVGEVGAAVGAGSDRRTFRYKFKAEEADRTSHYLIFASKWHTGKEVIQSILAKVSSQVVQGVPTYEFRPRQKGKVVVPPTQTTLWAPQSLPPLDQLQENLVVTFAGATMSVLEVRRRYDHVNDRFTQRNYKDVLLRLEGSGRIEVSLPAAARPSRNGGPTLADHVMTSFPSESA